MRLRVVVVTDPAGLVRLEGGGFEIKEVGVAPDWRHVDLPYRNQREGAASPAPRTGAPGPSPAAEAGTLPQVPLPSPPTVATPAAAMPKFRRNPSKSYRTEERAATLVAAWPGAETMAVVLARLNAMAGPPLPPGPGAIYRWAAALGLGERPNRPPPAGRAAAGAVRQPLWRTAEREVLLRELWPQVVPAREIQARLNALPGPALPSDPGNVYQWGVLLKLAGRPGREIQALVNRRADGLVKAAGPKLTQPEAVAASNQARGVALVRERVEAAAPVPVAVPPLDDRVAEAPRAVPELPAPVDGVVYASFREVQAWAGYFGIGYDGGNMDRVNKLRAAKGLCRMVQSEDRAA